jgi:hypothetical protein
MKKFDRQRVMMLRSDDPGLTRHRFPVADV